MLTKKVTAGSSRNQQNAQFLERSCKQANQMTVAGSMRNDVSKTHRTADCHDQAGVCHTLSKLV